MSSSFFGNGAIAGASGSGLPSYYADAAGTAAALAAPNEEEHKEFMSLLDALENAPDAPPPEDDDEYEEDAEKDAEHGVDLDQMRTRIDAIKARRSQVAGDGQE